MLLQLACVVLVAVVFFGDPRVRSTYDVFGLALLAALIADRFGFDAKASEGQRNIENPPSGADVTGEGAAR